MKLSVEPGLVQTEDSFRVRVQDFESREQWVPSNQHDFITWQYEYLES